MHPVAASLHKVVLACFLLAFMLVLIPVCSAEIGGANPPVEYKIKAAFLLNFAKFITWPEQTFASPQQPFSFCVLGRDPFGTALTPLQTRTVAHRPIHIKYVQDLADTDTCQMLFIADSEKEKLPTLLKGLEKIPVVTVSDIPGFAEQGGTIEFVLRQGRLSFKINLAEARKHHLHINASLLSLATEVIR